MDACPGLLGLATISGYYAQLTGVLAGFAFTALVVVLTPARPDARRISDSKSKNVPLVLFAAFVALVIASLTYSVLAGDSDPAAHGRAATLELIDGVPFGLAAVMLFQGVTLLLEANDVDRVAVWTGRVLTVVVAPTLTMYYIVNGATDTGTARLSSGTNCPPTAPPSLGLWLSGILAGVLVIAVLPWFQPPKLRRWADRFGSAAPIAVLAISVAAAIVGGGFSVADPDTILTSAGVSWYLIGTFTLLLLLGLVIAFGYGDARDAPRDETP